MIGKPLLRSLALLAIVSAVASAQPARHWNGIPSSIISIHNGFLGRHYEARAPQDDNEEYRIGCRMRGNCHALPKPTSTIQNDKKAAAAKTTPTSQVDESVVDWVSILNAPGPVMTDLPSVMTTTTTDFMARHVGGETSSVLEATISS